MASPIRKQYREAYFLINLNKTSEYMLSSVEIPSPRICSFRCAYRKTCPGRAGVSAARLARRSRSGLPRVHDAPGLKQ